MTVSARKLAVARRIERTLRELKNELVEKHGDFMPRTWSAVLGAATTAKAELEEYEAGQDPRS